MNQDTNLNEYENRERTLRAASMVPIKDGEAEIAGTAAVDDQVTQQSGPQILCRLRDNAFDGDDQKLAMALGRPAEEIQGFISGEEPAIAIWS